MEPTPKPRHVAIIMDGNGRWAEQRGLDRTEGHRRGADSVRDVVRAARELGLEALTLYAFSAQNWQRPVGEVAALMALLRDYVISERSEIMNNGIRLQAIGEIDRLPAEVRDPLGKLITDSAKNDQMALVLALSYGGQESLADAARSLAEEVAIGARRADAITVASLGSRLPTTKLGLPKLDLLIRTSGERRLSNFLLWECAYAELYFTETLWPDFRREHLYAALDDFVARQRRFGLTSEQAGPKLTWEDKPSPVPASRSSASTTPAPDGHRAPSAPRGK